MARSNLRRRLEILEASRRPRVPIDTAIEPPPAPRRETPPDLEAEVLALELRRDELLARAEEGTC